MADENKFEHKTVKTVRGTDGVVIAKMQKAGWELIDQTPGTVRTALTFRRRKKLSPWIPIGAAAVVLTGVITVGAVLEVDDQKPEADKPDMAASFAPSTPTPSEPATPSTAVVDPTGLTITVECFAPDFENSIKFTIDRKHPDFSEAWSTPLPVSKVSGSQQCDDAGADDYGDGPMMKPLTPAEDAIWKRWGGSDGDRSRLTLAIPYYMCVEHDSPALRNTYPDHPNLAEEAENMLLLCPDHPNAAAMRKRIEIQNRARDQIGKDGTDEGSGRDCDGDNDGICGE